MNHKKRKKIISLSPYSAIRRSSAQVISTDYLLAVT